MLFYYNESTLEVTESQIGHATHDAVQLAEDFLQSEGFAALPPEVQEQAAEVIVDFARLAFIYHHNHPPNWSEESLTDVLVYLLPGKVVAEEGYFQAAIPALGAFFDWLHAQGLLPNAAHLQRTLTQIQTDYEAHVADPQCWSMSKHIYLMSLEQGLDIEDEEQSEMAGQTFTQQLQTQFNKLEAALKEADSRGEFDRMLERFLKVNRDELPNMEEEEAG
jgi:hypothetical protein